MTPYGIIYMMNINVQNKNFNPDILHVVLQGFSMSFWSTIACKAGDWNAAGGHERKERNEKEKFSPFKMAICLKYRYLLAALHLPQLRVIHSCISFGEGVAHEGD